MSEFSSWFETKYLEWQIRESGRKSVDKFSTYLGVSQPAVSSWLNGHRKPTGRNVEKLAEKLGPEIYDLLGLQRPDQDLQFLARHWHQLSDNLKKEITETAAEYLQEKGEPIDDEQFAPGNL